MSDRKTIDVGGQETYFNIPDGAIVTGAVLIVSYQLFECDDLMCGTSWGTSAIQPSQAIGMIRQAQIAAEGGRIE